MLKRLRVEAEVQISIHPFASAYRYLVAVDTGLLL